MDFGRGISIQEEKGSKIPGTWSPVTPGRPIPMRPQANITERHGNQTARSNWLDNGVPTEFHQGNTLFPNGGLNTTTTDQYREVNNWDSAVASRRLYEQNGSSLIQPMNNGAKDWNSMCYQNLLDSVNAGSGASGTQQRAQSNVASPHQFPFPLPPIETNQFETNSANILLSDLNYSISTNQMNGGYHSPQMTQLLLLYMLFSTDGFPVPYGSTYDLNSSPETMADAISNGNISFPSAAVTMDEGDKMQNHQLCNGMSEGSMPFWFASLAPDKRMQNQSTSVVLSGNTAFQYVPATQEGSKMQNNLNLPIDVNGNAMMGLTLAPVTPIDVNGNAMIGLALAPVTPEKEASRMHHHQLSETVSNLEDCGSPKHNYIELHSPESCLQSLVNSSTAPQQPLPPTFESTAAVLSTQLEDNHQSEKEGNDIDLNKTPHQKSRKKKYTPRVLKEGKPKRAPKSTEKQNNVEGSQKVKRKYVRKTPVKATSTPSTDVQEINEVDPCVARRSCKRSLNFDLVNHDKTLIQQENAFKNNDNSTFNNISESQAHRQRARNIDSSPVGIAFDLNRSSTQEIENYISLPPEEPQPTRRELLRQNLEIMGRNTHDPGTAVECETSGRKEKIRQSSSLQSSIPPVSTNQYKLDSISHTPLAENREERVSKRAHSPTPEDSRLRSMNLMGAHFNDLQSYAEMLFPDIYKKRRSEKIHISRSHVANDANTMFHTSQGSSFQQCYPGTKLSSHQGNFSQHYIANGAAYLRNGASMPIREHNALSLPTEHSHHVQNILADSSTGEPCRTTFDNLKTPELMLTIRQTDIKTRKRSKGHTRVRDLTTLTSLAQYNNLHSSLPGNTPSHDRRVTGTQHWIQPPAVNCQANFKMKQRSRKGCNSNMVCFPNAGDMRIQEHQVFISGNRRTSAKSKGPLIVIQQLNSPLDDLIQKFEFLSMNGGSNRFSVNEQTALVPFKGDHRIVPYEGKFDPNKRKKPRPKVDLDMKTQRVWNFLMGKEATDGVEGTDLEQEWDEQRHVFRGRTDLFIARMHLIQGDRAFTPWYGSVLDSVIGVFLTQNVSDHLSSSAFMNLASRFQKHTSNEETDCQEGTEMYVEEPEVAILDLGNSEWYGKMPSEPVKSQDSRCLFTLQEAENIGDRETGNSSESIESTTSGCFSGISDKKLDTCEGRHDMSEDPQTKSGILTTGISCASSEEAVDRRTIESENSGISPQNSAESSLLQVTVGNMNEEKGSSTLSEDGRALEEVVSSKSPVNSFIYQKKEVINSCSGSNSEEEDPTNRCKPNGFTNSTTFMELLHMQDPTVPPQCYNTGNKGLLIDLNSTIFPNHSEARDSKKISNHNGDVRETLQEKMSLNSQAAAVGTPYSSLNMSSEHPIISSEQESCLEKQLNSWKNHQLETNKTLGDQPTEPEILDAFSQRRNSTMQQAGSNSPNFSGETLDVVESMHLLDKKNSTENTDAESVMKERVPLSKKLSHEITTGTSKPSGKPGKEKKKAVDWDYLRKEAYEKCGKRERNPKTMDSLDWEAVRCADVKDIAKAIKERGMNNMLAERIKDFLDRLVREHGSLDLEWLRDAPPDKVNISVEASFKQGVPIKRKGIRTEERRMCPTLDPASPCFSSKILIETAVQFCDGFVHLGVMSHGRKLDPTTTRITSTASSRNVSIQFWNLYRSIFGRGYVHLIKEHLSLNYRYELHYQLITFGKVFCTKSKPNCNACPMRAECKHFASAFASARLALPGPEEKGVVSSTIPNMANQNQAAANQTSAVSISPMLLPPPEQNILSETITRIKSSEPIIEVPASPEPECHEVLESDIEDAFYEDPDEIPTIKLNIEDFASNLQNYMQKNMELQDGDVSKALVALTPEAASIPTAKLKNVSRLRTEHQVYELPDSHPLLKGMDKRVPGEVCSYLLAIWTPGETAESIQPPERCCGSQISGDLCSEKTCFSCNGIREANAQTVRGTLLIPSKTAMRGSFPLNGTYFQVNEVFADHASSLKPIDVPRAWLWNLPRRTVFFGTSIPTIFKGQTTEQIQNCFWRGYVCVRGFDQKTRAPRPLLARLHFPASRLAANIKAKRIEE
ncbi:hypothetical protein IFM89_029955 [Coptis chinensis]|uniref:Transcriptional activator DEMETER n=1 Tax=Coptis chinensis TaxID=261450 RepID=A0A835LKX6_9MAGN|nr:hypothetical protein IFM89_029955 [Coptis chinensis]